MNADVAIQADGISKRYLIRHKVAKGQHGRYVALRDVIAEKTQRAWNRIRGRVSLEENRADRECFWALRDVSFEINRGECVGIIGRNGAGKSTLLKILSRVTHPTEGQVSYRGRMASLLEVGSGFHPELTGRENIYLNGAILGMSKAEIQAKFDEIVAFAEVERFLDTPVKRYSSGMYVRLAFAVAAHLDPDILVVDEVLAVGDASFQKKCLTKMGEAASEESRTVLFVSHNLQSISTLTTKAMLIDAGRVVKFGPTREVLAHYQHENQSAGALYEAEPKPDWPGVVRAEVITSESGNVQVPGRPMKILLDLWTPFAIRGAWLSVQIMNQDLQAATNLWTSDSKQAMCRSPGRYRVECTVEDVRLFQGEYFLRILFTEPPGGRKFEYLPEACRFQVEMLEHYREFPWQRGEAVYIEHPSWFVEPLGVFEAQESK